MSPLIAPPNRGFGDWQRINNWDSGDLYSDNGLMVSPKFTSWFDCSRFAYVVMRVQMNAGQVQHVFQWDLVGDGLHPCGTRAFMTDSAPAPTVAFVRLMNMGPFVRVQWTQIGGTQVNKNTDIYLSNRFHPLEFIPTNPNIMNVQAQAIGAGATVELSPSEYYSGPCVVYCNATVGGASLRLQSMNQAGPYATYHEHPIAVGDNTYNATVPNGAWRVEYANPGTASVVTVAISPSTTGSL